MSKRIPAIVLAVTLISLAIAPETQAHRFRRDRNRSGFTTFSSYPYRTVAVRPVVVRPVAVRRVYSSPYYGNGLTRYYGRPYSSVVRTQYYGQPYYTRAAGNRYYRQPYYTRVAGTRYYGPSYYRGYRNRHSTRNAVLTVVGPAAVGAGIGAIAGGGKGAGIGALIGGGGGALYYLLRNRSRRY